MNLRTSECLLSNCEVIDKLGSFSGRSMEQRRQSCGEFRQPFPGRQRAEFHYGLVTTQAYETLATTDHTVNGVCKMTRHCSNKKKLCHQQSSIKNSNAYYPILLFISTIVQIILMSSYLPC